MAFDLSSILQQYSAAQEGFNPRLTEFKEAQRRREQEDSLFKEQIATLKLKREEDEDNRQVRDFAADWMQVEPLLVSDNPQEVMQGVQTWQKRIEKLKSQNRDSTESEQLLQIIGPGTMAPDWQDRKSAAMKLGGAIEKEAYAKGLLKQPESDDLMADMKKLALVYGPDPLASEDGQEAAKRMWNMKKDDKVPSFGVLAALDVFGEEGKRADPVAFWNYAKEMEKSGPATQIIMGQEESALSKAMGPEIAKDVMTKVQEGDLAIKAEQSLSSIKALLDSNVDTGTVQPFIKPLQGIASDFGVDLDAALKKAGIANLGSLAKKEEFERVATELVIDGFAKFKGNLNAEEVKLAVNAFPNLGKSEAGNKIAYATLMASTTMAKKTAARFANAKTPDEWRALKSELLNGTPEEFMKLRDQYYSTFNTGAPIISTQEAYDALPPGTKFFNAKGEPRIK